MVLRHGHLHVCRVMQGSCAFWWPQQLGVCLASAHETAFKGNAVNRYLCRNSGFPAVRETAVWEGPCLFWTRLQFSATVASGNLVLRAVPQTQRE